MSKIFTKIFIKKYQIIFDNIQKVIIYVKNNNTIDKENKNIKLKNDNIKNITNNYLYIRIWYFIFFFLVKIS